MAKGSLDGMRAGPLPMIDKALHRYADRRLVSSIEVVDLLLDVRSEVVLDATLVALLEGLEKR